VEVLAVDADDIVAEGDCAAFAVEVAPLAAPVGLVVVRTVSVLVVDVAERVDQPNDSARALHEEAVAQRVRTVELKVAFALAQHARFERVVVARRHFLRHWPRSVYRPEVERRKLPSADMATRPAYRSRMPARRASLAPPTAASLLLPALSFGRSLFLSSLLFFSRFLVEPYLFSAFFNLLFALF